MEKMLLIQPHYDDSMLSALPFLLGFPGEIHEIVTSEGDFLDEKAFKAGKEEFEFFKDKLNSFRQAKGLGMYIVDYEPKYGDVTRQGITPEAHAEIFRTAERLLQEPGWEYFIYSSDSIHPNHTATRQIAEGLARTQYLRNIKMMLMAVSEQEQWFRVNSNLNDCVYKIISEEDFDFFKKELYPCFKTKLINFPWEPLENRFRYIGDKVNAKYAQNFIPRRIILD